MPSEDTQFKPGQSGNPAGCPSFRDMIAKIGAEIEERHGKKMTKTEKAVRAMFSLAEGQDCGDGLITAADVAAFRVLAQHSEGTKSEDKSEVVMNVVITDETKD